MDYSADRSRCRITAAKLLLWPTTLTHPKSRINPRPSLETLPGPCLWRRARPQAMVDRISRHRQRHRVRTRRRGRSYTAGATYRCSPANELQRGDRPPRCKKRAIGTAGSRAFSTREMDELRHVGYAVARQEVVDSTHVHSGPAGNRTSDLAPSFQLAGDHYDQHAADRRRNVSRYCSVVLGSNSPVPQSSTTP